jgi:hypothetical protein
MAVSDNLLVDEPAKTAPNKATPWRTAPQPLATLAYSFANLELPGENHLLRATRSASYRPDVSRSLLLSITTAQPPW